MCRYYLLNTTLPIVMCGYLALLVFSMNKASLEARIDAAGDARPYHGSPVRPAGRLTA